jgi:hypothetical protein
MGSSQVVHEMGCSYEDSYGIERPKNCFGTTDRRQWMAGIDPDHFRYCSTDERHPTQSRAQHVSFYDSETREALPGPKEENPICAFVV